MNWELPDVSPLSADLAALVDELTNIVARASAAVVEIRARGLTTRTKADLSPVTSADEAAEAVILEGLARTLPGVCVVSEEARPLPDAGAGDYILVDPLDGTRELVAGRDEFCINLALVRVGRPQLGIIAAPALGQVWRTAQDGAQRLVNGGSPDPIRTRPWPGDGAVAAVSRSHLDSGTAAFLAKYLPSAQKTATGSAIKLCRLAEGAADVYPRFSPVNQWDIAAGDAILAAAGGCITTPSGNPLVYRRDGAQGLLVPGFIAWGDPQAPRKLGLPT
jgi:3'(2'), 5'-bisphosphate nucleotidase